MTEIIKAAFSDAPALLRTRMSVWAIMTAICVLAGIIVGFVPFPVASDQTMPHVAIAPLAVSGYLPTILGGIATYFIIPAAARTVRPSLRMTIGRLFGLLGTGYAVVFAFELGLALLIVPGFWFGIKWSQYIWTFLLSEGEDDPLDESWRITTGRYWETFGFLILIVLVMLIPLGIVWGICVAAAAFFPISAIVTVAVAFLAYIYLATAVLLAQLRWAMHLRTTAAAPVAAA